MKPGREALDLEVWPEERISPELDAAIREMLGRDFTPYFSTRRHYHDCVPAFTVIGRQDGTVLGQVGVVLRAVRCGDAVVQVAGIQSLCVAKSARGSRLAADMMKKAMAEAKRRGVPHGMLFCSERLSRFYARLGWLRLDVPVTLADEGGRPVPLPQHSVAMTLDLGGGCFPPGDVYLQGREW